MKKSEITNGKRIVHKLLFVLCFFKSFDGLNTFTYAISFPDFKNF